MKPTFLSKCCDALPYGNETGYGRCSMCGDNCTFYTI